MSDLYDHFYRQANDMFDSEVFAGASGHALLDAYNDREDDGAREVLFDIVNEMVDEALGHEDDHPTSAMRDVLMARKHEFFEEMAA